MVYSRGLGPQNMAKEKDKKKEGKPRVNPELLKVERTYQRERLITEAKPRLWVFFLLIWFLVDVLLIVGSMTYFLVYYSDGRAAEAELVARVVNNTDVVRTISESRTATALTIRPTSVISTGDDRFDFYVEVQNPNTHWYATFDYYFKSSQGNSDTLSTSIMPSESRGVTALGQEFNGRPNIAELNIENLVWHRVGPPASVDIEGWLNERNNFLITDSKYSFEVNVEGDTIPRTSFTVQNATPYSYWSPEFQITIIRAGRVSGVNSVTLPSFESGETRDVQVNWFGIVPSSGTILVTPVINYFDESVYMPLSGGNGGDIRDNFIPN